MQTRRRISQLSTLFVSLFLCASPTGSARYPAAGGIAALPQTLFPSGFPALLDAEEACACKGWEKITISVNGVLKGIQRPNQPLPPIVVGASDHVNAMPTYRCYPPVTGCLPGFFIRIDGGTLFPFLPSWDLPMLGTGTHTISIQARCGKTRCRDSSQFQIQVRSSDCACVPGSWTSMSVITGKKIVPFRCQTPPAAVSAAPGVPLRINVNYECRPPSACVPNFTWKKGEAMQPPGPVAFTPQAGATTVTIYAWCRQTKCDSCKVIIKA